MLLSFSAASFRQATDVLLQSLAELHQQFPRLIVVIGFAYLLDEVLDPIF